MNADTILSLLRKKHVQDIFVPNCKTGPSWTATDYWIFDAWVMNKSWTNQRVIGYEIKVSRSDFLQDSKWRSYLGYCNMLYFLTT